MSPDPQNQEMPQLEQACDPVLPSPMHTVGQEAIWPLYGRSQNRRRKDWDKEGGVSQGSATPGTQRRLWEGVDWPPNGGGSSPIIDQNKRPTAKDLNRKN